MVRIETLLSEGKISKINETEFDRYVNFFECSSKENLGHAQANAGNFPRWAIISGYYAMHDATKLFLAKKFRIKMEAEVHSTTIKVLREVAKNSEIVSMLESGYREFLGLANDLYEARKERVKAQYYTGTQFMREEYRRRARTFLDKTVTVYLEKIGRLSA